MEMSYAVSGDPKLVHNLIKEYTKCSDDDKMYQTENLRRVLSEVDLGVDIKTENGECSPPPQPNNTFSNIFNKDSLAIRTEEIRNNGNVKIKDHEHNNKKEVDVQKTKIKEEMLKSDEGESFRRNGNIVDIVIKNDLNTVLDEQKNSLNTKISCSKSENIVSNDKNKKYYLSKCREYETANQESTKNHPSVINQLHSVETSSYGDKTHTVGNVRSNSHTPQFKTTTSKKPFACNHCDYKSRCRSHLIRHSRQHTGEKPYACNHCDYRTNDETHLIRHNRQHTGEKPYVCNQCDYRTSYKSDLTIHSRHHTGEKPYACKHCDYRSRTRESFIIHIRQHTGEKPFACKHCDYKSSDKSSLNRHNRQHTGEKPFACNHCDYRSSHKSSLTCHNRQHTGEKPFTCNHCDYKSISKSLLNRHNRQHTGGKKSLAVIKSVV